MSHFLTNDIAAIFYKIKLIKIKGNIFSLVFFAAILH